MFYFYSLRKHQKTRGFLIFSGYKEIENDLKWVKVIAERTKRVQSERER